MTYYCTDFEHIKRDATGTIIGSVINTFFVLVFAGIGLMVVHMLRTRALYQRILQGGIVFALDFIQVADRELARLVEVFDVRADFFQRQQHIVAVPIRVHVLGDVADRAGFFGASDGVYTRSSLRWWLARIPSMRWYTSSIGSS